MKRDPITGKQSLSKRTQAEVDKAMNLIHAGHVEIGCRMLSTLHRCGNTKERMIIEEYRDNSTAIYGATEIVNGCMVVKE